MDTIGPLFECHHARLERYVASIVGTSEAPDISSQVFLRMLEGHLPNGDDPWPWMRKVARNLAIDHLRRQKLALRTLPALVREVHEDRDVSIDLRDAIATLPEVERTAILATGAGYSGAALAEQLGRSTHAVHCVLSRARARLRALLEPSMLPGWILVVRARTSLRRFFGLPTDQVATAGTGVFAVASIVVASLAGLSTFGGAAADASDRAIERPPASVALVEGAGVSTPRPAGRTLEQSGRTRTPQGGTAEHRSRTTFDQREGALEPNRIDREDEVDVLGDRVADNKIHYGCEQSEGLAVPAAQSVREC